MLLYSALGRSVCKINNLLASVPTFLDTRDQNIVLADKHVKWGLNTTPPSTVTLLTDVIMWRHV